MKVWAWILAALSIPFAYWLATVAIGAFAPAEIAARAYLKKRLRQLGVGGAVPDDCIRELAARSLKLARFSTITGESQQSNLLRWLELDAELVAGWVDSARPYSSSELQEHRQILERHGVQRRTEK
jgi:hypothetical protein